MAFLSRGRLPDTGAARSGKRRVPVTDDRTQAPPAVAAPHGNAPRVPGGRRTATIAWYVIGSALVAGMVVLVGTVLAADRFGEPVDVFTRDVQDYVGVEWYTGSVRSINVIAWSAAAALALAAAWLEPRERLRMGLFGALVTLMTLDDALLLHEAVGPENGIPQEVFLGLYAVSALALLVLFMRSPRTPATVAFFLGASLLGVSVVADEFFRHMLVEDGAKLLGTFVWITVAPLTLSARAPRH